MPNVEAETAYLMQLNPGWSTHMETDLTVIPDAWAGFMAGLSDTSSVSRLKRYSNVLRLATLRKAGGGLYLDLDMYPLQSFDTLYAKAQAWRKDCNAIFSTVPMWSWFATGPGLDWNAFDRLTVSWDNDLDIFTSRAMSALYSVSQGVRFPGWGHYFSQHHYKMMGNVVRARSFHDSRHCQDGINCSRCRDVGGGRAWRSRIAGAFEVAGNNVNFTCPKGKPWHTGQRVVTKPPRLGLRLMHPENAVTDVYSMTAQQVEEIRNLMIGVENATASDKQTGTR